MGGTRASLGKPAEWKVSQYSRLSTDAVKFANKLNRQALNNLEFTWGGQSYLLAPNTAVQSSEFSAIVQCSINGHSVQLGFDSGLCAFLLSDWLPLEEVAALPEDLKKSVIVAALNPVAEFFAKHSAGSFNVEDIECQSAKPPPSSLFFNLSSTNGALVGRMFANTDEQTIDTLNKIWQVAAKPAPPNNTAELPVWVEVIAGGIALSLDEFGELKEDDIILLDTAFSDLKKVYARISDNICFLSVIDGNRLIIQKSGGVMMASDKQPSIDQEIEDQIVDDQDVGALDADPMSFMNEEVPGEESQDEPSDEEPQGEPSDEEPQGEPSDEESQDEPSDEEPQGEPSDEEPQGEPSDEEPQDELSDEEPQGEPSDEESLNKPLPSETASPAPNGQGDKQTASQLNDLGGLSVELLFVVDQFKTTVKEIERIKPGYVFELNKKAIGQAEIRANGTPIGIGELVQIEDRAGVRVLKLYGQTETDE